MRRRPWGPRALTRALTGALPGVAGALVVLSLLASAACSDDDAAVDDATESQPGGLDADQVQDRIGRLLADYDDVVNQIIANPQVTEDPEDPLVQQYLDLFEPDSEFARQALDTWRNNAADGITIEPFDPANPANLTRLDGDVEIVSDDEVRFPTCSEFRQLVHQNGRIIEGLPFMEQPGQSVAVLDDDGWVFRRRDVFTDVTECKTDNPDAPETTSTTAPPSETTTSQADPTGSQPDGATEGN
jgi:hypothetical protein